MSTEDNKAVVGRWFTEFWGPDFDAAVIDEIAAPDIRFEYSLHAPLRGRDAVRDFATKFRAAFPDLAFGGTADLIAEGDYVIGQWIGGGTHTGEPMTTCRSAASRRRPARRCVSPAHGAEGRERPDHRGDRPRRRRLGPQQLGLIPQD